MTLRSLSDGEIFSLADPIMDNLMLASTDIDHARHVRDFTDRMKAIVTKEHLASVCRDYQARWGVFTERSPLAVFRRNDSVAIVWKQKCSNTDDEFVAEMVLVESNGKKLVDHVMVF